MNKKKKSTLFQIMLCIAQGHNICYTCSCCHDIKNYIKLFRTKTINGMRKKKQQRHDTDEKKKGEKKNKTANEMNRA